MAPREELDRALGFLRRALKFWPTALVVLLVGELACAGYILLNPPRYRSQTVLLYSESIRSTETGEAPGLSKTLAVRMGELATSRTHLQQLIEEFDLYPDTRRSYGMSDAVDELRKHVEFRAPGGDTFTVSFEGSTPAEAQKVTARLAELVIERDASMRKQQTATARDFLASEKKRAASQLQDAEQDLAGFMAEHPRFALDTMPLATGAAIRATVGTASQSKSEPRTRLVVIPRERDKTAAPVAPAPSSTAPTAAELEALREAEAERSRAAASVAAARQNLNDKRTRYTEVHPDVRDARDELARAQARLDALMRIAPPASPSAPTPPANASDAKSATKPPLRYVEVPVRPRSGNSTPQGTTEDLVALETDWSRLTRAVTEARQRHDQVEAALFKADIASSSASVEQGSPVAVIDPAFLPPRPVPPGPRKIAALFFVASLLAGIFAALGRVAFDDRIQDEPGAAALVEVLVSVPRFGKRRRAHA